MEGLLPSRGRRRAHPARHAFRASLALFSTRATRRRSSEFARRDFRFVIIVPVVVIELGLRVTLFAYARFDFDEKVGSSYPEASTGGLHLEALRAGELLDYRSQRATFDAKAGGPTETPGEGFEVHGRVAVHTDYCGDWRELEVVGRVVNARAEISREAGQKLEAALLPPGTPERIRKYFEDPAISFATVPY